MKKGQRILAAGLGTYAVLSLISMATMSIGIGVVVVAMLAAAGGSPIEFFRSMARAWKESRKLRVYLALSLALALACALSLVVARIRPLGYGGHFIEVSFWRDIAKAWYLFWPWVLFAGLRSLDPKRRDSVLAAWLLGALVISVIGVQQFLTCWPRQQMIPGLEPRCHATTFLGHHLSVASILIFPVFCALELLVRPRKGHPVLGSRAWLSATVAAGVACLFLTFSRTLWVALPVAGFAFLLMALPPRKALGAAIAAVVLGIALTQLPAIHNRLNDERGVDQREELWRGNIEFFKQRPLTGTGWHHNLELSGYYEESLHPGQNHFSGHAHNNLIEMLGGTGIVGAIAWLAWSVGAFWLLLKRPKPALARGLLCAWIAFQINGLTQVNFWESKVLHQIAWAIVWSL